MRAPLSIVIPTLNAGQHLPATLSCLIEGIEAGLIRELVISDGGSVDTTLAIAHDAGALVVSGAPGRGGQLGAGASSASGDWILFLHADTHLGAGWAEITQDHINTSLTAGYFGLRFRARGLAPSIVSGWANLRSRFGLPYGDQGLLISRELYDRVGGFSEIPLMEDVAMARALRGKLTRLDGFAYTDAKKYQQDGWFRRGARNMWTLARYWGSADPKKLADRYDR